jgi:acyl-coenzyme A thioesterase PaaI-like protein
MARSHESPGARMRSLWDRLSPLPGGRWLFSRLLGWMVPYTASIGATVMVFEPGHARVRLRDRRRVRNHLRSVHAIALANVGELSTGLALIGALGPELRGILTGLDVTYLKKARGELVAEARCSIPEVLESTDYVVEAEIRDAAGHVVAITKARWRLSPTRPGEPGA